jgi:hypothetical protein
MLRLIHLGWGANMPGGADVWQDMVMYWAWRGEGEPTYASPTEKKLDYATLSDGSKLCIGVWDSNKYTPLHRAEYEKRK